MVRGARNSGASGSVVTEEKRRDAELLEEMRWAIEHIENEMLGTSREEFAGSQSKQAAVAFYIMDLGDAAGDVSMRTKHANPEIPWDDLAGRRFRPAHRARDYLAQDAPDTWRFLKDRLPKLARKLRGVRAATRGGSE